MLDTSIKSPFLRVSVNNTTDYANFLCGKRCQNKRERERIENAARARQLEQEAALRDKEIESAALITEQQKQLNELQSGIQQNVLLPESSEASYAWVWWVVGLGIAAALGWWYFKKNA